MTRRTLLILCLLAGCTESLNRPSEPQPWTHRNFNDNPEEFQFAIIADRTGGHRPGVFEKGIEKLNLLRPEFVMSVGDLIEGYTKDPAEIDQQWDEVESFIAKLDIRTEEMAGLISRVLRGEVLQISPVLAESAGFERGAAKLTFTNDSDVAMIARGEISPSAALRATPDKFEVSVPAHSTATVNLELGAPTRAAVTEPLPLAVKWSAAYQLPGRPPLNVPREDVLGVDRIHPCAARTKPVVIDGNLDEWKDLSLGRDAPSRSDLSYRFGVTHDDEHVYIAVKATDDRSVLNALKEPWAQDGVEIRLDARPEPLRSQGRGRGEFKEILVISMSPGETPDQMVHHGKDQLPTGVRAICAKTETGHALEAAIPVSYLNDRQGGTWQGFRLNVAVDDYDSVAGPLKALWWRPDWRSRGTFARSGTFEKK